MTPSATDQPSTQRVLVVDDEPDVQVLFRQRLRRELRDGQLELQFAGSGDEAIKLLDDEQAEAMIVFTDVNMPGMTGLELLEEVHTRWPHILVYLVTAYDNEAYRDKATQLGASGYFTKPVSFDELKRLLLAA